MMFWILGVTTILFLVLSAVQDLEERMVYIAPAIVLHGGWIAYIAAYSKWDVLPLFAFFIVNLLILFSLDHFAVWGSGDSYLFFLVTDLCFFIGMKDGLTGVFLTECIYLAIALVVAVVIGIIEARLKHISIKESVAVVPGLAVVAIILCIRYGIWR